MDSFEPGGNIDIVGIFADSATTNANEFIPTTKSAQARSSCSELFLLIVNSVTK